MAHLIIKERGEEGAILSSRRCAAAPPSYWRIRDDIGRLFPDRKICSPLDACAPNALQLIVYVSPNKEGRGRISTLYRGWAVNPE